MEMDDVMDRNIIASALSSVPPAQARTGAQRIMYRILYIEDNADNRNLVRRVLLASDYPFAVELAEDARTGIEMARSNPPDLILMDLSMPIMDGLTATQHLRQIEVLNGVPIIALTANVMRGDRERSLNAGCDGYIGKPIDVDKLPEEIMSYIRNRKSQ
jgi:two-component system cell cycle response regulator DivK